MATTPGGLPYPVGTDFVVDGDNAIRALAEELDGEIFSHWKLNSVGGALRPLVGGAIAFDGAKSGTDASTISADKTTITLARTGIYRVNQHFGLAGNAGAGTQSGGNVNGTIYGDSLMYGNTGAAGVFVASATWFLNAVAGATTLRFTATAPLGLYDWSWLRLTYIRRNRT